MRAPVMSVLPAIVKIAQLWTVVTLLRWVWSR